MTYTSACAWQQFIVSGQSVMPEILPTLLLDLQLLDLPGLMELIGQAKTAPTASSSHYQKVHSMAAAYNVSKEYAAMY